MRAVVAITEKGFTPYGGCSSFWYSKAPEIIVSGPYDTGKTLTALNKLNYLMSKYAGSRGLMIRKTYQSLVNSALVTFEEKVHKRQIRSPGYPIDKYGGEKAEWYDYPNGSRLVVGGMDNPGKTLSSEFDFIYVNQAEELTEDEWQALTRAASGRAGHAPFNQVMGDCNPDVPEHWIQCRQSLTLFESRHEDNPDLYDQETGELMEGGKVRMRALDNLTGVRKQRGRYGLWVGREGQVYEFDPAVHLLDRFDIPGTWTRYRAVDFGFTNPFVCQWWAEDPDGRLYLYREIYMTQRTVTTHATQIKEFKERIEATIADHDAEDRATLAENGIKTIAADKRVSVGIEKVQERLKLSGDKKPRLFVLRDSLVEQDTSLSDSEVRRPYNIETEFPGYVWPTTKAKRAADEHPVKADDHSMDTMRYMIMHLDGRIQYPKPKAVKYA